MQSPRESDQFWIEIQDICESLNSDIYLPPDIEAHLRRAPIDHYPYQSYPTKLREALIPVENLFSQGDEGQREDEPFIELDNYLKAIGNKLQSIVSSLERSSSAVRDSAESLATTKDQATHVSHAAKHLSDFVDALRLPNDIHNTVTNTNPHSDDFKHALDAVSRVLSVCDANKDAPAVQEFLPSAKSIRDLVTRRINKRLRESFELMKEPSSSFVILRDTLLLQHRPLIHFLKDRERASFDWLTEEYVKVAKLAFDFQVRSFYDELSSCGVADENTSADSSYVASSATKFLSSFWEYSSSVSVVDEGHEADTSERMRHTQRLEGMNEGLSHLISECEDVLRSALDPPLTTAELQLMRNPLTFSFSGIFRQLLSFFLKYEKAESRFVTELFGDEGKVFLAEIFGTKGNLLLQCLEHSCQSLKSTTEIEQLCMSLYVCRRLRENIKTHQELDHRIAVCVIAERIVQTRFVSCLDSKAAMARECLLKETEGEATNFDSHNDVTWFCIFIARLLQVVRQGDKWTSSQDLGYASRRRLSSTAGSVTSLFDSMNITDYFNGRSMKSYMRFFAEFLFAIDACVSLPKGKGRFTEEIWKEVQDRFRGVCEAYARIFVDSKLQELTQLENSGTSAPFDTCSQLLSVLREKQKDIENLVRRDIMFLQSDPIGVVYEEAVRYILNSFRHRLEALKLMFSSHHPELLSLMNW